MKNSQTPAPELKICPFCGGEATKIHIGNEHVKKQSCQISCVSCNMKMISSILNRSGFSYEWIEQKVTDRWNQRTTPEKKGQDDDC
tara:strand:+ start:3236 stop:3493 length:258 start_codon:yes stop_codon:yes gene_type:complete